VPHRDVEHLSASVARRIALAAQGFATPRPSRVTARHIRALMDRMAVLQLDSVNVFCRSHYIPVFSRLGPYDRDLLDDLTAHRRGRVRREFVEYWAHMAALIPVELRALFSWRMDRVNSAWGSIRRIAETHPTLVSDLLAQMRADGPIRSGDTGFVRPKTPGEMWNWHEGKIALEYLFFSGQVMASRRVNFERWYDLTEHVLPVQLRERAPLPEADQWRELTRIAVRACGVATLADVADYFRMKQAPTKQALAELLETGEVLPARVAGWDQPAYLWADTRRPRRVAARALLSPFDPVVWFRPRTERLFGFHYRIEIYTPAPNRTFGYYVLPFLLGDRLVARVDLKSDRAAGVLRVQAAHQEAGVGRDPDWPTVETVAGELAEELAITAGWLGLAAVEVRPRGELAAKLAEAVASSPAPAAGRAAGR
jgi:uncharacterized protein YcaQ